MSNGCTVHPQMWNMIQVYALWCLGGACLAACTQAACACAGACSRRALHERLLRATLHAPLQHHLAQSAGDTLHRFSSDTLVVDKVTLKQHSSNLLV